MKRFKLARAVALVIAVLTLAGCHQKISLEGSQVEVVKVEGRRFEVRVELTGTPNEYRMLIIRATMVINPDPELGDGARPRRRRTLYEKAPAQVGPTRRSSLGCKVT